MPDKRLSVGLFVVAGALALAACDGSAAPDAAGLDPAKCADPNFASTHTEFCAGKTPNPETPATDTASLPNGLKVRIISAKSETADTNAYDSGPTENVLVTIATEITNTGNAPFLFPSTKSNVRTELLYGANHAKATNSAVQKGSSTDLPEQLVAGGSVTMTSTFTMRAGGADNVVFRFNPHKTTTDDVTTLRTSRPCTSSAHALSAPAPDLRPRSINERNRSSGQRSRNHRSVWPDRRQHRDV
ncbi:hypothetical protein [Amycolatopsis keratiniphila]|uniref:hypothetical protein n=1 Tax=Amycolatopsis keratiniphila TaxID=129921 RepID=UPI000F4FC9DF|nr:hypothetical protein [Amycolatopsis keratiniphila]